MTANTARILKRLFLTVIVLCFNVDITFAQLYKDYSCGTMENQEMLFKADPDLEARLEKLNKEIEKYILSNLQNGSIRADDPIVTIPVVYHVVWSTGSQNIAENTLKTLTARLNLDYRRNNSDASQTRAIFLPFAADAKIEFCMATKDPQGNSTNGITRTQTSSGAFNTNNNVKSAGTGGANPWPSSQYLNVWVCDLVMGLGGYGQFPGGPSATDGIVVDYLTVTASGRTTTHEVGHWLGLPHIFQDGCQGNTPSTCLSAGDRVCDTPQQGSAGFGCNFGANTCTETPTNYPDMIENFMSYNSCQNMFSLGQATRMASIINTFRTGLKSSLGCCSPTTQLINTFPHAEGIEDSIFPPSGWSVQNPEANVTWSRTNVTSGFGTSNNSAKMYFYSPGDNISGQSDFLLSPNIDFSSVAAPITLTFSVAYARFSAAKHDSLIILMSNDQCEDAGTRIWAQGDLALATAPDQINEFIPANSEWKSVQISLDNFAGSSLNYLVFEAKSGHGNNMYIDDINISFNVIGINESDLNKTVNIYPNPAQDVLILQFNSLPVFEPLSIKLYNVLGQTMISHYTSGVTPRLDLDIEGVDPGIYFIEIRSESNLLIHQQKIVVSN